MSNTKKSSIGGRKTKRGSNAADPLASLVVFDRLEVGPVKLEPRRLKAPYRLYIDGKMEETELVYRFEEDVFEPSDDASVNLASMMAAQLALNYGLFCKEMVFHGIYDEVDRRFLVDMAQNTAREIYVKKFLEPNPFLVGAFSELPAVKAQNYLRSSFVFQDKTTGVGGGSWRFMPTNRERCVILSSGGKDSLLSFGLMTEAGADVHPVFINESGRHWFTAQFLSFLQRPLSEHGEGLGEL